MNLLQIKRDVIRFLLLMILTIVPVYFLNFIQDNNESLIRVESILKLTNLPENCIDHFAKGGRFRNICNQDISKLDINDYEKIILKLTRGQWQILLFITIMFPSLLIMWKYDLLKRGTW